nr:DUF1566 domain-containing protein [uncultured Pseudomonas sp.]
MKRAMITVKQGDITVKVPADTVATTFISAALAQIGTPSCAVKNHDLPALGEYWPGEGGHYAGVIRGENGQPDYHLIVAAGPAAEFKAKWGGYEHETPGAKSPGNGMANTKAMLADSENHPAATAAAKFTADGHADFYLPARRELQVAEANVPELFSKAYHWSSTQRSANGAFSMGFGDGCQGNVAKRSEWLVRPVRRILI